MTDESTRPGLYVGRFYVGRTGLIAYLAVSFFVVPACLSDLFGASNGVLLPIVGAAVLAALLVVAIGAWRGRPSDRNKAVS